MNRISITKKIELRFDDNGLAITDLEAVLQELKNEYAKKYSIDERSAGLSVNDGFLYITVIARELKETKSIGFKR